MSNYITREAVKAAVGTAGADRDAVIDRVIAQASAEIDQITDRWFIPRTATRSYPWPQRNGSGYVLYIDDADLLTVTALTKDGDDLTAIAAADYFAEPVNETRKTRIEIDLASSAFYSAKDTRQRAVRVTGTWGYDDDTVTAGTVVSGLASDAAATSMVCSNGALVGVGDTLLIQSEQVEVTAKTTVDLGVNESGALTASVTDTTLAFSGVPATAVNVGEVLLIGSERMRIREVTTTTAVIVERAYDGSTLATHANADDIYVYRTLTIARAVNGTTAAVHANATQVSRYTVPGDIAGLALALAAAYYQAARGGWTGEIGGGDAAIETRMVALGKLRDSVRKHYRRHAIAAV